ncbi:rhamnulokinase [Georgenia sp. H159]|uniref:rhamnulokinase n=1 Tax=Georgenia sp. H159 TaxID=3076115 RepID=UPI002D787C2B|nr:FGGY-family carbohydrate kinase [Georgenia sp. H159]
MAVDLGASSGRVMVGRLSDGRLEASEVARFPNGPVAVPAGERETLHWDVLRLYDEVVAGLRAAAREHGPLASVGIDSWAVDYGLLDADGALLGNPVHYRDARTEGVPEQVFAHLPAPWLYARNGLQVLPFNTVFQLAAATGSAQLAAAERLLLVPDLLGHWLSGAVVAEVTNASTTGLLDVTTRRWSDDVLSAFAAAYGTDVTRLLPRLVEPGTVVGRLRPGVGAGEAALVAVGSHDTASAVAAVPARTENFAYVSCGTWSLVGLELDAPVLSEAGRRANFTNELGVDGTVRYLRNVMGLWVLQECLRTWEEEGRAVGLAELLAATRAQPPLERVIDLDDAAFLPPGDMPARVAKALARTGQPAPQTPPELARCVLDSLALAYRRTVRQAAELSGHRVDVVHVVGGGSRNELLCQLTADATGLPVVAGPAEGTAVGNLLTQAQAAGALSPGLGALREVVAASTPTRRYEPQDDPARWRAAEQRLWG